MKQNTRLHPAIYRFGVVTALPKEFAAMRAMLDESKPYHVDDDPNEYVIGTIPAIDGNGLHHIVVTLLKKAGSNSAAATVSHLLRSFPSIQDVLMVGIAGGVPHPQDREKHVRLGDIVVSNEYGVVQFDNIKLENGKVVIRGSSTSPSAALIGRINYLESERLSGKCPWEAHVLRAKCLEGAQLPSHNTDRLFSSVNQSEEISHPDDPNRIHGKPKVHYGKIGSSNTLLRDAKARDALRKELKIHAVEMEGSGIADGAWVTGKAYILIGLCT